MASTWADVGPSAFRQDDTRKTIKGKPSIDAVVLLLLEVGVAQLLYLLRTGLVGPPRTAHRQPLRCVQNKHLGRRPMTTLVRHI